MPPVRKNTRKINVGGVIIGGGLPIVIQSMTNTSTSDYAACAEQINALSKAGCKLVRCSVPDAQSARAISEIKKRVSVPICADIHFDFRLALLAIENGADKLRLNPGNIGGREKIQMVAKKAKERGIPIRIGVNSGSLEREILEKHKSPTAEAIVESALKNAALLEQCGFYDIIISVKSSDVFLTVLSYEKLAEKTDYPLHVGVTEAGTEWSGGVKSAVGIGSVLSRGIGDTIRVSLTGDPLAEIKYAKQILKSLGYTGFGADLISCPTCARTRVNLQKIAAEVEERLLYCDKDIKVAVMGCAVNGPGEARTADLGIAAGDGSAIIFRKGKPIGKFPENEVIDRLFEMLDDSKDSADFDADSF